MMERAHQVPGALRPYASLLPASPLSCERDLHFSQVWGLLKHPLRPFLPGACRLIDLPRKGRHSVHLQIIEQAESPRLLNKQTGRVRQQVGMLGIAVSHQTNLPPPQTHV
jgi:hypothetical protein